MISNKITIDRNNKVRHTTSVGDRQAFLAHFDIKKIIILLCLLLVSNHLVFSQRTSGNAKRAYDRGMRFYRQDTYDGYVKAIKQLQQARGLYQQSRNKTGEALSLFRIGQSYRQIGYLNESATNYIASFELYSELRKRKEMTFAANNVASLLTEIGKNEAALEVYRKDVLPYIKRYGSKKDIAKAYNGVGQANLSLGNNAKALSQFRTSLANWRLVKASDYDEVRATYGIAIAQYSLGNKSAAKTFGNKALGLARTYKNPAVQVDVLEALAQVYDADGDKKTSATYRLEALEVYKKNRSLVSENQFDLVANNLAFLYYRMGNLKDAASYAMGNVRDGANGKDYPSQTYLLGTAAETLVAQGKYKEAIKLAEASISRAKEANDTVSEAYSLAVIGDAYQNLGKYINPDNYKNARYYYEKALKLNQSAENPNAEAKAILGLITVHGITGSVNLARPYLDRIRKLGWTDEDSIESIQLTNALARYYSYSNQHKLAIEHFIKAIELAQKRKNIIEMTDIMSVMSYSLSQTGDYKNALDYCKIMIQASKTFDNKYYEAYANMQAGWMSLNLEQQNEALDYARRAVQIAKVSDNSNFLRNTEFHALHISGKANYNLRNYDAAINNFNKCLNIAKGRGDKALEKHFWLDLAQVYTAKGDKKKAKKARKKANKIK